MLQEIITGPEVTVGVLCDGEGRLADYIAMERELENGRTVRATAIEDARIDALVRDFVARVPCAWAVNLQLRLHPERGPVVFEINARLSGSTAMRRAVGFDDPARMLAHLTGGKPIRKAPLLSGVTIHRDERLAHTLARATSLVFDCGDTLIALDPSREQMFADAAQTIGLDLTVNWTTAASPAPTTRSTGR